MQFRKSFIRTDGRLADPSRQDMSHSEGQGIALLLAEHHDDPAAFARVWGWTRRHLQVRSDRLLAWSWTPAAGVTDHNNATDGDLLVAWALARAGKRWGKQAYLAEAEAIARDIRLKLLRPSSRGLVLLPGMEGFEKPEHLTLNLSYWVFPAFPALAELDPAPEWQALGATGIALLHESRFGQWGLPPDWLDLGEIPVLADGFPPRFGYDAIRIPLYLLWAGLDQAPLLEAYRGFWSYYAATGFIPAWIDLVDETVDSSAATPGMRAIAQLSLATTGRPPRPLPALEKDSPYYSAALLSLCKLMLAERGG